MLGIKFDLINHHFKLKFVNSGLYFVQDGSNFITGSGGPKSTDPTGSG